MTIEANNVKAFFRRGEACYNLKDFEQAQKDFKAVLEIESNNGQAKKYLVTVQTAIKKEAEKEKKMFSKMFG